MTMTSKPFFRLGAAATAIAGLLSACGRDELGGAALTGKNTTHAALDFANTAPGRGYNVLTDRVHDFCLEEPEVKTIEGVDGKQTTFSFDIIDNVRTLSKMMSVSAAASINFGVHHGEGKAKFVSELETRQSSLYALVSVRVRNTPKYVANPRLAADAAAALRADPERFRERCGDGFISYITSGAEYYGLIEVETSSEKEKQDLKASAQGGSINWSVKADFERAVSAMVSNKSVHVRTYQAGGDAAHSYPCRDVDCLLRRTDEIIDMSTSHPELVDAGTVSYRALALPTDDQMPVDVQAMQETETMIVERKFDMIDMRSRWLDALREPTTVSAYDPSKAQKFVEICERNIHTLQAAASLCFRDYRSCRVPALEVLDEIPPRRLIFSPPWPGPMPRFEAPTYGTAFSESWTPCAGGADVLTTNAAALARVDWAIQCNLLAPVERDTFLKQVRHGQAQLRARLAYPSFARGAQSYTAWRPDLDRLESAAGEILDCSVPADVSWAGTCIVEPDAEPDTSPHAGRETT